MELSLFFSYIEQIIVTLIGLFKQGSMRITELKRKQGMPIDFVCYCASIFQIHFVSKKRIHRSNLNEILYTICGFGLYSVALVQVERIFAKFLAFDFNVTLGLISFFCIIFNEFININ